jgi:cytochrome c553
VLLASYFARLIESFAMKPRTACRPRGPARIGLAACVLLASAIWATHPAAAGDPAAGRKKAAVCRACHGMDGLSRRPDAPHIAGQSALYMRAQLVKYRSGERLHPLMNVVAKTLSDADIDDLVAYYSNIEITVVAPQ